MAIRTIVFLILNFGALAIGSIYTSDGVSSQWYTMLDKAPWTPPGWVFGAAWVLIMICFSLYMAFLWKSSVNRDHVAGLYLVQWLLNISWNPVFFYHHKVSLALILIISLAVMVVIFIVRYWRLVRLQSAFIFPYLIWLLIAISLNWYILFSN
ncbi:MAG: tryptophan-rich sensory protein [Cyclobacteriaceae bacterium]